MITVTLHEAQVRLAELIANLQPGEEIVITRDNQPVARLTPQAPERKPRLRGNPQGKRAVHGPGL